jgi:hypothetical protein
MTSEYVKITGCPKCHGEHKYRLEVKRALVIKMLTPSDMCERPRAVRFTRLFTCPKTQADYQAIFTLTDTSFNRIEDVKVLGEARDDEQE